MRGEAVLPFSSPSHYPSYQQHHSNNKMAALLDPLYCHEGQQSWDAEDDADEQDLQTLPLPSLDSVEWAEILSSLSAKERVTHPGIPDGSPHSDPYLSSLRQRAVEWVVRACARHGFCVPTEVLAVSYLDCFFLGGGGLRTPEADSLWTERLSAIACLSLAAKMEETHVPLLLDLQAEVAEAGGEEEDGGGRLYLFEAKTVRRMELLVLSALGWRMNPVTPLTFIEHVLPKVVGVEGSVAGARLQEVVRRCHAILLYVIADWRWLWYPPSVWAGAVLLHAMGQPLESCESTEQVFALLGLTKGRVQGCYQLILSGSVGDGSGNKRKLWSPVWTPNGAVDACFNCDSNCNWSGSNSGTMRLAPVLSSPETPLLLPPVKKLNCNNAGNNAG